MNNTSPRPEKTINNQKSIEFFDFPEAIRQIMQNKKVTRKEWSNALEYGFLNNGFLSIHKADEKIYQWIVNDGDLFANDWFII